MIGAYSAGWGVLLGAIYLSGFVIVTTHLAKYGIAEFEILRARVLAAGILFFVWFGAVITAMIYRVNSDSRWHEQVRDTFYAGFQAHLIFSMLLLSTTGRSQGRWSIAYAVWASAIFMLAIIRPDRLFSRPRMAVIHVALFGFGLVFAGMAHGAERASQLGWILLVSVMIVTYRKRPITLRGVLQDPSSTLLTILPILTTFSLSTYGDVQFRFGGGELLPVMVYSSNDYRDLMPESPTRMWIVERASLGYYAVPSREDRKAWFLPSASVRALRMLPSDEANTNGNAIQKGTQELKTNTEAQTTRKVDPCRTVFGGDFGQALQPGAAQ